MIDFDHPVECGCCGHHATEAILNELTLAQIERATLDFAGLQRVLREETGDAPYVPAEVSLTQLLAEHTAEIADEIEGPILRALGGTHVDASGVITAATGAAAVWQARAWPTTLEAKVGKTIDGAALIGQFDHGILAPPLHDVHRLQIVNGMVRSAKYTTNNYFNTQVMPALVDAVNSAVLSGNSNDAGELEAIRAMLDRRLRSVPYWNTVANAATSRAYHYGYIKTGIAMGKRTVRYQAILDARTSQMCINLNGLEWYAGDVSLLADRIATATVEEVKVLTPWLKPGDIDDWSPASLLGRGVVIPPIHGRCRSKLVFTD